MMNGGDAGLTPFLADRAAQDHAITGLVAAMVAGHGDGLDLDFEFVAAGSKDAFTAFVTRLRDAQRAAAPKAELTLAMPSDVSYPGYDVAALGAVASRLLLMEYDFHDDGIDATGPVAPLTKGKVWDSDVESAVDGYLKLVPPSRLAMGLPFYGYDWPAASSTAGAKTQGQGESVDLADAIAAAEKNGRRWDDVSQTPWYAYKDGAQWHQVWYDDVESLRRKARFLKSRKLAGSMIWAVGMEHDRSEPWEMLHQELTAR
jgi:spore germination protein